MKLSISSSSTYVGEKWSIQSDISSLKSGCIFFGTSWLVFRYFPIYLLDLSTCQPTYNSMTKMKVIFVKILLNMNYEVLYSDLDIEYFNSIFILS